MLGTLLTATRSWLRQLGNRPAPASTGAIGERAAAASLRKAGYRILERNWTGRTGEVDLIVRRKTTIAFVEVKTRRAATSESAFAAVGAAKQRQVARAASEWWQRHRREGYSLRFDVVAVLVDGENVVTGIEHIEAAFESPLS